MINQQFFLNDGLKPGWLSGEGASLPGYWDKDLILVSVTFFDEGISGAKGY